MGGIDIKRKILCILAAFVLAFAFTTGALAATIYYGFDSGTCYRTFTTSGSLAKDSSKEWDKYTIHVETVSYTGTQFNYLYARPVGADGSILGLQQKAQLQRRTGFEPNAEGRIANTVKFKVYNADYEENSVQTNNMSSSGELMGMLVSP